MKKSLWIIAAGIFLFFGQSARVAAQAPERGEGHTPEAKSPDKCDAAEKKKKKFP